LSHAFEKTTATYKYFWFISILQIYATTKEEKIFVKDIVVRMVANAWYPVHYFKLSFGKLDNLFDTVRDLQQLLQIPIDSKVNEVVNVLTRHYHRKEVSDRLMALANYVPYRFLNPWLNIQSNPLAMIHSQRFEGGCPYGLFCEDKTKALYIRINPEWCSYLIAHYRILLDFAFWNLTIFLQAKNPNVPAISDKLMRSEQRHSLAKQRTYWNRVIDIKGSLKCIYTGREILSGEYDLDHFIPWSFVSHDLLWNLVPADRCINSSKSNKLPDLGLYLPKLARLQQESLQAVLRKGDSQLAALDDYFSLGFTPYQLSEMSDEHFMEVYERTFHPIHQIAMNMGFEAWVY
jgi:5-methylcytosine-specific restriction endonuclease McrA